MIPKNILVLYKKSTYEYYRTIPQGARPDLNQVDRFRETHDAHYETLDYVDNFLKERGLPFKKMERGQVSDYSEFDFIIAVGGDGTFLEAAQYTRDQILLGVNSDPDWSVGRLCRTNRDNFSLVIDKVLSGAADVMPLNRLKFSVSNEQEEIHFLNDILVCHKHPASLSRYVLSINGKSEEQRGSGIWISTAAGSTGAIHSAGGKVLDIQSKDFQYRPRELYKGWNPDEYQLRGGVLGGDQHISVTSLMTEGVIFIDGSHRHIEFSAPRQIVVKQSEFPLHTIQTELK